MCGDSLMTTCPSLLLDVRRIAKQQQRGRRINFVFLNVRVVSHHRISSVRAAERELGQLPYGSKCMPPPVSRPITPPDLPSSCSCICGSVMLSTDLLAL